VAHFPFVRVLTPDGRIRWMTPVQADGKGFPDIIMVRGGRSSEDAAGRIIIAELKVKGGELSDEQAVWLALFRGAGIEAYVWFSWEWDVIESILRE
jgi:hypothetical protein